MRSGPTYSKDYRVETNHFQISGRKTGKLSLPLASLVLVCKHEDLGPLQVCECANITLLIWTYGEFLQG